MKRLIKYLLSILLVAYSSEAAFSQCKAKQIVKGCRATLKPYFYDGYAVSDINFGNKPQKMEVEFTAFAKQKYRLVFCTSGFAEPVVLNIFDKSSRAKVRNKVYSNEKGIEKAIWNITPPKTTTYYIQYDVPASTDGKDKTGCVVMLISYSDAQYGAGFED